MKWLIGTACIAVIAASGFAIGKPMYDAHQQEAKKASALRDLVEYAHGEDRVAMVCRLANKNPELLHGDHAMRVLNTCYLAGVSTLY